MRQRLRALVVVCAGVGLFAPPSRAQDRPASDAAVPLAETLYQRARDLMAAGRYAEACADFAESHRIDPATGGTLLNLAVCHEKIGRFATAAAEFEEARALARHYNRPDREDFATRHLDDLKGRVSTVSIVAPTAAADETLSLDGVVLSKVAYTNVPVDPGDHVVVASAAGKAPWRAQVTIGAAQEARTIEVPPLADLPAQPAPGAPAGPSTSSLVPASVPPPGRPDHTRRDAALATGAAGLAAIAVGAAFGVGAIAQNNTSEQHCPAGRCDAIGASDSRTALADANVANVCIGAGVVAVGVAAVLLLTAGKTTGAPTTARVGLVAAGSLPGADLGVGGAW